MGEGMRKMMKNSVRIVNVWLTFELDTFQMQIRSITLELTCGKEGRRK
jgi:hypothetical protein